MMHRYLAVFAVTWISIAAGPALAQAPAFPAESLGILAFNNFPQTIVRVEKHLKALHSTHAGSFENNTYFHRVAPNSSIYCSVLGSFDEPRFSCWLQFKAGVKISDLEGNPIAKREGRWIRFAQTEADLALEGTIRLGAAERKVLKGADAVFFVKAESVIEPLRDRSRHLFQDPLSEISREIALSRPKNAWSYLSLHLENGGLRIKGVQQFLPKSRLGRCVASFPLVAEPLAGLSGNPGMAIGTTLSSQCRAFANVIQSSLSKSAKASSFPSKAIREFEVHNRALLGPSHRNKRILFSAERDRTLLRIPLAPIPKSIERTPVKKGLWQVGNTRLILESKGYRTFASGYGKSDIEHVEAWVRAAETSRAPLAQNPSYKAMRRKLPAKLSTMIALTPNLLASIDHAGLRAILPLLQTVPPILIGLDREGKSNLRTTVFVPDALLEAGIGLLGR